MSVPQAVKHDRTQTPAHHRTIMRIRHGVSLLEVVLSIAILGGALAALSSIVLTGADAATDGRDRIQAQLLCEQQLAQVLLNGVSPTPYVDQPLTAPGATSQFTATLEVQPAPLQGLLALRMTVKGTEPGAATPGVTVSMTRWWVDPLLGLEQLEAEEQAAAEEAAAAEDAAAPATGGI